MHYLNDRQTSRGELTRRIELLTQQRTALLLTLSALQKKVAEQKKALEHLTEQARKQETASLHAKELELAAVLESEPAIDERDAGVKRRVARHRVVSPLEQQIEAIKGDALTHLGHFLICLVFPSYGMIRVVQIRSLRQQARREWESEVQSIKREIKEQEQALRSPRYSDEQRTLLALITADEREWARLEQQAHGKDLEIASLQALLPEAQVADTQREARDQLSGQMLTQRAAAASASTQLAYTRLEEERERTAHQRARRANEAQLWQKEEEARLLIVQAQIDEALARKRAAELLLGTVQARVARSSP